MAFVIKQLHVRHCTCITSYDDGVNYSTSRQGVLVVQKSSFVCLYMGRTHTAPEIHVVFAVYEHNEDGISIGRRERHGVT